MSISESTSEILIQKVLSFRQRFGEPHFYLACHAALPLALTPDLLYRLWANFQRDIHGEVLQIPWIAVADLLLSTLCQEVAYEIYEMDATVRNMLLNELKDNNRFGVERISELANFLLDYVKQQLTSSNIEQRDLAQAQHWAGLAYTQPLESARDLATNLAELDLDEKTEWVRLSSLIETLAEPLIEAEFEPLVIYAQAMSYLARGNLTRAAAIFAALPTETETIEIAGVRLLIPDIQRIAEQILPPVPPLQLVEFEIAQLVQEPRRFGWGWQWIVRSHRGQTQYFTENLGEGIGIELVSIPSNHFWMGTPEVEVKQFDQERPYHHVTVAPFFIGKYPVTQQQWQAAANMEKVRFDLNPDPSRFKGANRPVEGVLWREAVEFCERLKQHTGKPYRLPSEAEWEYACRAGTTSPFSFGATIMPTLACYDGSVKFGSGSPGKPWKSTTDVGSFNVANAFGLYDMHGNVWEWCLDHWHENYDGAPNDGTAWITNDKNLYRILRGGSWIDEPKYCRSAYRNGVAPTNKMLTIGFRIAVSFADSPTTFK
jgi:formylglycine-generating enzyme required for sulfatase activity